MVMRVLLLLVSLTVASAVEVSFTLPSPIIPGYRLPGGKVEIRFPDSAVSDIDVQSVKGLSLRLENNARQQQVINGEVALVAYEVSCVASATSPLMTRGHRPLRRWQQRHH